MATILVAAVLLTLLLGLGSVVLIARTPAQTSTPLIYAVLAFTALALKILLAILQSEFSRRQIVAKVNETKAVAERTEAVVRDVDQKVNGNLAEAMHGVAAEVRAAEREQLIDSTLMPKTPHELEDLLSRAIRRALAHHHREAQHAMGINEALTRAEAEEKGDGGKKP